MSDRELSVPMTAVPIGERLWVVPVQVATYIQELEGALKELSTAIRAGSYEDPSHDRIYQALLDAKALLESSDELTRKINDGS